MVDSEWTRLHEWWIGELEDDPVYVDEIEPLIHDLLGPVTGSLLLDVGCGEGRLQRTLTAEGASVVGVDLSQELLVRASPPVVRLDLPDLGCFRHGAFDGAYVSLVLEHLEDERRFFGELSRVIRPGGVVAMVINHPIFTAPDSAPIQEPDEIVWRPGGYFGRGFTDEPAGKRMVRFYHRTMADLLTAAADAGLCLVRLIELGVSDAQVIRTPVLGRQRHIPRLLGAKWQMAAGRETP